MTEINFEVGKTYTTRDGRNAIIYAIHPEQNYCIHGAVWKGRVWCPDTWAKNGCYNTRRNVNPLDLMPPEPETHVRWVNVYGVGYGGSFHVSGGSFHVTRETADKQSSPDRKACIRIKWHEGQYDD